MANNEFDQDFIREAQEMTEHLVVQRMTKIALQAHNRLTVGTPVDTGQARAGWNFALNEQKFEIPESERPTGWKSGDQPYYSIHSPQGEFARRLEDKYFLVNAVEHIIYLNEGHSEKAPSNFIERETAAAVTDVERGS